MRKLLPLLMCLLLLTGCSMEALFADKYESNPINVGTTSIIFGGQEANGPVWVVTDDKTIARLQDSYRWTNKHMLCCLEGTVTDYLDFYEGSRIVPWELSRHKLYADNAVPAYNAGFRRELRVARDSAIPMYRTMACADLPSRAAEVEVALPGCIVAVSAYRPKPTDWLEMHILTPEPLTAEELSVLRQLDGVRIP